MLKELVPDLQRLGVLSNPANPATVIAARGVQQVAHSLGLMVVTVEVRGNAVDQALVELRDARSGAALVLADPVLLDRARNIVEFMSAQRLIAMYAIGSSCRSAGCCLMERTITSCSAKLQAMSIES